MQHTPANPTLWRLFVQRARAKFSTYPSPAASHWVHEQYVKAGGRFVATDHPDQNTRLVDKAHLKKANRDKKEEDKKDPQNENHKKR